MKQKISIIIIEILSTLFPKCKYIGGYDGYDIVKGSKAIKEIKEKITSYSLIGTLYTLSAATTSSTCPSSSSATIVKEAEPNNTYKYANKFDFLSPTQSTRLQGTITTGNSDYDIFYMAVPSDTTYTKFYYKGVKSSGACGININSDGSELSNDTTTYNNKVTRYIGDVRTDKVFRQEIKSSEYIFFR